MTGRSKDQKKLSFLYGLVQVLESTFFIGMELVSLSAGIPAYNFQPLRDREQLHLLMFFTFQMITVLSAWSLIITLIQKSVLSDFKVGIHVTTIQIKKRNPVSTQKMCVRSSHPTPSFFCGGSYYSDSVCKNSLVFLCNFTSYTFYLSLNFI